MNAKLNRIFTPIFFFAVFSHAPASVGIIRSECYEKIQDFLILRFGEDFQQDENIVKINVIDTKLTMIIDKTPTVNPPRYFFYNTKDSSHACLVLTTPIANDVDFSKSLIDGVPAKITTRSSGQESNDMTIQYKWIESKRIYKPVFCTRGIGNQKTSVSCKKIHSAFGN